MFLTLSSFYFRKVKSSYEISYKAMPKAQRKAELSMGRLDQAGTLPETKNASPNPKVIQNCK